MKTNYKIVRLSQGDGTNKFEVRKYSNDWFSFIDPSYGVIAYCDTLNEAREKLESEIKELTQNDSVVYETTIESKRKPTAGY